MALRSDILSHGLHHFAVGIGVASVLSVVGENGKITNIRGEVREWER